VRIEQRCISVPAVYLRQWIQLSQCLLELESKSHQQTCLFIFPIAGLRLWLHLMASLSKAQTAKYNFARA